jgi:large subunit ribosomal protein L15
MLAQRYKRLETFAANISTMERNALKRHNPHPSARRVGRGGKRGKTSGRGGKGQTARAGSRIRPEIRDFLKKIPKRRGFGKNRARTVRSEQIRHATVNLRDLENSFEGGATVTPLSLLEKKLIRKIGGRTVPVKILGTGVLTKKLTISDCQVSSSAKAAIEQVGGTVQ